MNKEAKKYSPERRHHYFLGGLTIILSLLMWQACIERITLSRSSGWAIILLLEIVGINFLALALYLYFVRLGSKSASLDETKSKIVKGPTYVLFPFLLLFRTKHRATLARISALFSGLVAISISIIGSALLLSVESKYLVLDQFSNQYKLPSVLTYIFAFPFALFILVYIALMFQPLIKWIQSGPRMRIFVFSSATVLALIPLANMFEYQRSEPMFELGNSYDWFKDLRGPRVPPPNDLVVVAADTKQPLQLIRTLLSCKPKETVIVVDTNLISDAALDLLNKAPEPDGKILLTSYVTRNVNTPFSRLRFAQLGQWAYIPLVRCVGEDDSLTASFQVARECNTLGDIDRFEKYVDEYSCLMYEPYSRWGFVTTLNVHDIPHGWRAKYFAFKGPSLVTDIPPFDEHTSGQDAEITVPLRDRLAGRVLIIDLSGYSGVSHYSSANQESTFGMKIAATLLNIQGNDFVYRVPYGIIALVGILVLLGNLVLYRRLKVWAAISSALLFNALVFAAALLVYAEWSVLIYVTPIFTSVGIFTLIVFPYELVRERAQQLEERTRLATELKTAHEMQMGLMPINDPIVPGFDISGICKPAEEVGGDFFDYVWLDEKRTRLGIAIGDVSGKAMKAAITAVLTSGMVYREASTNETPKSILRKINKPIYLKTDRRMFTAMTFAVIDIRKKTLTFSNAGQMHPLMKRVGRTESLKVQGAHLPLGMAEDVDYRETFVRLRREDTVVFYTDGVPEAMNAKREMFGFERLEALVKTGSPSLSSRQLATTIVENVAAFTGPIVQNDDMTVVVVRVL